MSAIEHAGDLPAWAALVVSFFLSRPARIQLIAKKGKQVVGKTPMTKFKKGRAELELHVSRKRYPNKLAFRIHELGKD